MEKQIKERSLSVIIAFLKAAEQQLNLERERDIDQHSYERLTNIYIDLIDVTQDLETARGWLVSRETK